MADMLPVGDMLLILRALPNCGVLSCACTSRNILVPFKNSYSSIELIYYSVSLFDGNVDIMQMKIPSNMCNYCSKSRIKNYPTILDTYH